MTTPEGAKGTKQSKPEVAEKDVKTSAQGNEATDAEQSDIQRTRAQARAERLARQAGAGPRARGEAGRVPGARRAARLAAERAAEAVEERVASGSVPAPRHIANAPPGKGREGEDDAPGQTKQNAGQTSESSGSEPLGQPDSGADPASAARSDRAPRDAPERPQSGVAAEGAGGARPGARAAAASGNANLGAASGRPGRPDPVQTGTDLAPTGKGPGAARVPATVQGDKVPTTLSGGGAVSADVQDARKVGGSARAPVPPAKVRRRHRFMMVSFLFLVILPVAATYYYLFEHAQDRYASTAAFFVHREDTTSSVESVFGLAAIGGGTSTPDADVLYQFIQSQQMVELADARLDLRKIYTSAYDRDPVFALDPEATLEDMVEYWGRVVSMLFAPDNGLITLEVIAYDPDDAQDLAQAILDESSLLIDTLSQIAREDAIDQSRADLVIAEERLKSARIAIAEFRSATDFVDPTAGVAGAEGLINALQQELAVEIIARDTLIGTTTREDDPRLERANRKIASIRERIEEERGKVGSDQAQAVGAYEELLVDRQFAEQSYTAALAAYDAAVAEARRKSRYLAVHIEPTRADTAVYPKRMTLGLVSSAFIFMAWAIFMLVLYSINDRR